MYEYYKYLSNIDLVFVAIGREDIVEIINDKVKFFKRDYYFPRKPGNAIDISEYEFNENFPMLYQGDTYFEKGILRRELFYEET